MKGALVSVLMLIPHDTLEEKIMWTLFSESLEYLSLLFNERIANEVIFQKKLFVCLLVIVL